MDVLRQITHVKIHSAPNKFIPPGKLPKGIVAVVNTEKQKEEESTPLSTEEEPEKVEVPAQETTTTSVTETVTKIATIPQTTPVATQFSHVFELGALLGQGAFSMVFAVTHKQTKDTFAAKVIDKAELQEFDQHCLASEIQVLTQLLPHHDHIVRLYNVYGYGDDVMQTNNPDDDDYIYLVMERIHGGELLDRLIDKEHYTECEARHALQHVLSAMHHCHTHQIAHRDLKPENLLLTGPEEHAKIKVADFGFAKHCPHDLALHTQCGSAMHVGPEILRHVKYGTKIDCWALGVIAFTLLSGYPPFYGDSNPEIFHKILAVDYAMDDPSWNDVSDSAKDMIQHLLVDNPNDRWSVEQALHCEWMTTPAVEMAKEPSLKPCQLKLKEYSAKRKLKAAVYAVMGLNTLGAALA